MRPHVAVVGPADADDAVLALAGQVGALLGAAGAVVVTGGLGGVMAAASEGARRGGGLTLGVLPGTTRDGANPFLDVALPTGLDEGRNVLVVRAAQAVVAVGGSWGTLSEVALAVRAGVPVVQVRGWTVLDADGAVVPVPSASSAEEAVRVVLDAVGGTPPP